MISDQGSRTNSSVFSVSSVPVWFISFFFWALSGAGCWGCVHTRLACPLAKPQANDPQIAQNPSSLTGFSVEMRRGLSYRAPRPLLRNHAMARTLDIVVPVFNEEACVGEFFERIARLGYADALVFVDNGSTDGTVSLLTRHANVRIIRHATNEGYGG